MPSKLLYLISVSVHILSAVVWLGGMAFLVLAVIPAVRRPEHRSMAGSLIHAVGVRFRSIGWTCLALLVLTGVFNLLLKGFGWEAMVDGSIWEGSFGCILAIKLSVVAVILILSVIHDFYIGPHAGRLMREQPASPHARRYRLAASWMGRLNMLLSIAVVILAVLLVRGSAALG